MAFSAVPTPLYPLYMRRDGFDTFTVTVVFAVYAVGVVISLVLAGHVSDWLGRKRVLIPALALQLAAAVLFISAQALPALLVARLLTGLGVGMISATATAHLHELHAAHRPGASAQRFELVSTAVNIGGLGVGPLVAGILSQWVGAPLRVPYLVFAVLLLAAMVAVALVPETVEVPAADRPAYRPQRLSADYPDRAGYVAAAASGFAAFALFGLFTSIAPTFVAVTLHHPARILAGVTVFAVFTCAGGAQMLTNHISTPGKLRLGLSAQALGVVVLVIGMQTANFAAFLVGGMIAGIGAGILFKACIGSVVAMAAPTQRGEALAGLFLMSYLGLIVPVLGIGIASRTFSSTTAMTWFAGVLLVLLAVIARLASPSRRAARKPQHG
jgi:MFS family permease